MLVYSKDQAQKCSYKDWRNMSWPCLAKLIKSNSRCLFEIVFNEVNDKHAEDNVEGYGTLCQHHIDRKGHNFHDKKMSQYTRLWPLQVQGGSNVCREIVFVFRTHETQVIIIQQPYHSPKACPHRFYNHLTNQPSKQHCGSDLEHNLDDGIK